MSSNGMLTSLHLLGPDRQTQGAYLRELRLQGACALHSIEELLRAASTATGPSDARTWSAAQALLVSLGIIRRVLTGDDVRVPKGTPAAERRVVDSRNLERGRNMRQLLRIEGGNALLDATVRNAFEHIDDRLDETLESGEPYQVDNTIYREHQRSEFFADEERVTEVVPLRFVDVCSGFLGFRHDILDLFEIRAELRSLLTAIKTADDAHMSDEPSHLVGVFGRMVHVARLNEAGLPIEGDPFADQGSAPNGW